MQINTTPDRWLARAAGAVAALAAMYVLTQDAIASGHWTTDDVLMPVLVGLTILAAHLLGPAFRDGAYGWAAGFFVLAAFGISLIVYTSVGRQARIADDEDAKAAAIAEQIADHLTEVGKIEQRRQKAAEMLDQAQRELATECGTGRGTRCGGRRETVNVYAAAVKGHEADIALHRAEIAKIGPPPATGTKAKRMATVIAVFSDDEEATTKRWARAFRVFEPFAYSLFWELGALIAFGYGFGGKRRRLPARMDTAQTSFAGNADPAMFAGPLPPLPPLPPGPRPGTRARQTLPANVIDLAGKRDGGKQASGRDAYLAALAEIGGSANNRTLARAMGVSEGEATRRRAEAADAVIEQRIGKEVMVTLKSLAATA